jgi:hypothetical protein
MNATFSKESKPVVAVIETLTKSGMLIERVGEDAYNVISNATGAVLQRLIPSDELAQYVRCMNYVAEKHGRDITESYKYVKPVHS